MIFNELCKAVTRVGLIEGVHNILCASDYIDNVVYGLDMYNTKRT